MKLTQLQEELLAIARKNPPSDHVPYAFEKRIMDQLSKPVVDAWAVWGRALWRSALACVIAMSALCAWSYFSAGEKTDLSQEFEQTVYAALDDQPAVDLNEETW